jgi:hypothetical protein
MVSVSSVHHGGKGAVEHTISHYSGHQVEREREPETETERGPGEDTVSKDTLHGNSLPLVRLHP